MSLLLLCMVCILFCFVFVLCRRNTKFASPGGRCTIGHYCPPGTPTPKPCSPGSFTNHTTAEMCYPCPEGHYCVDGIHPIPCPAGQFSDIREQNK